MKHAVNARARVISLAALLGTGLVFGPGIHAQNQQPVPDAPTPQAPAPLPGGGTITPGIGTPPAPSTSSSNAGSNNGAQQPPTQTTPAPPSSQPQVATPQSENQGPPPEEGSAAVNATFKLPAVHVTEVVVPVMVKDPKGTPVAGLTWRDFKVYENNAYVPLRVFSVDPRPMSVAFVVDQTLPSNYMREVNESLGAIQGALTPYDEAAVFTYTNGAKEWTGFTGAQGNRLPAVLSLAQATGTDSMIPDTGSPFAGCSIHQNGNCVDPTLQAGGSTGNSTFITVPKEIHTLNDAILLAAKELSTRPKERLRVIYVISDGKEYGSKASWKEVVRYLDTNRITVDATVVGQSAQWGEGWLDRVHIPFEAYNNILYKYVAETGGEMFNERGVNSIEKSYAKIADDARNQYTLIFASHIPPYDDRARTIDVRVDRPNVVVTARKGYRPAAEAER